MEPTLGLNMERGELGASVFENQSTSRQFLQRVHPSRDGSCDGCAIVEEASCSGSALV